MLGELFPLLQMDHFEKERGRQDLTTALELSKCGNMKRLLGRELKRADLRKSWKRGNRSRSLEKKGRLQRSVGSVGSVQQRSTCPNAQPAGGHGIVGRSAKKLIGSPTGSGASRRWRPEARRRRRRER